MFGLSICEKTLWVYDIEADRDTAVKIRCLPMSGSASGTPCLIEKAWICISLDSEEAHNCNREMHFARIIGIGLVGEGNVGWDL